MDVAVAGGHGKVGLGLLRLLAARGDRARGLIRNPDHAADLEAAGAEPVLCDLEAEDADVAGAIAGAEAVVFAAGAGPGSGPERKQTVDLGGAVKLIEAARANKIKRYVMVSSMGADNPPPGDEVFAVYLRAKAAADEALVASGLEYTIVRPGSLTDDPGTGLIAAAPKLGRRGEIPRQDVAATLLGVLDEPNTIGETFELLSGEFEISEALRDL
jgi:uncharacterized protein YbjT (DUF2867 family)